MATSGTLKTNAYEGRYLEFSWRKSSEDIENETVTISWSLKGAGGDSTWYNTRPIELKIDGSVKYYIDGAHTGINLYDGTTVSSGTTTISVGNSYVDGLATGSFSVSIRAGIYYHNYNCTASGTFEVGLSGIASQPSCVTWPDHTQNVGEFGDTISIHMNRKNSRYKHTVRYQYGSRSGTIATNIETGCTWKIPLDFMDLIPNNTSGSGTIYVDTYDGNYKVGTKYCGFTATVPASVKPSCSATLEDIAGIDNIYGSPVRGLSKIKATVKDVVTQYSATVKSYSITIDGVKYSSSSVTTGALKNAGDSPVTVTVTDSRGRSGSWSYTMKVQAYNTPVITSMNAIRCSEDGTYNDRGEYIKVTFSAKIYDLGNKNTALYKLKYKKTTDENFTTVSLIELSGNYNPTDYTYIISASVGNAYELRVEAIDRHTQNSPGFRSTKAPAATAIVSWRGFKSESGVRAGFGIGRVPDKPDTLQVGWKTELENDVITTGNSYVLSTPGVAGTAGYVRMAQLTHKAAYADMPITFVFTRRQAPYPMTVYVQFESTGTTDPGLKTISYEGDNYGAFLVKSAASVWDLYVQKASADDTITMQSWYSSGTITDRLTIDFPGDMVTTLPQGLVGYYRATPVKARNLLDYIYPVGSIYISYSHNSPADLFGGTWTRLQNTLLYGIGSSDQIGLTARNIPEDAEEYTGYYTTNVSMWRRTA